jgi:hypothetical protein
MRANTFESWRERFSRTGVCWRIQISALWPPDTHHSLSDKVFSLLNLGHRLKSLSRIIYEVYKATATLLLFKSIIHNKIEVNSNCCPNFGRVLQAMEESSIGDASRSLI